MSKFRGRRIGGGLGDPLLKLQNWNSSANGCVAISDEFDRYLFTWHYPLLRYRVISQCHYRRRYVKLKPRREGPLVVYRGGNFESEIVCQMSSQNPRPKVSK